MHILEISPKCCRCGNVDGQLYQFEKVSPKIICEKCFSGLTIKIAEALALEMLSYINLMEKLFMFLDEDKVVDIIDNYCEMDEW